MTELLTNISNNINSSSLLQAKFWISSGRSELLGVVWFLVYSVILLVLGSWVFLNLKFLGREHPPKQKYLNPFVWGLVPLGILGFVFALFRWEGVSFFSAYAFWALHILTAIVWVLFFSFRCFKYLPKEQANYESYLIKRRYLPKRKKKS